MNIKGREFQFIHINENIKAPCFGINRFRELFSLYINPHRRHAAHFRLLIHKLIRYIVFIAFHICCRTEISRDVSPRYNNPIRIRIFVCDVENDDKTDKQLYVTGINCVTERAYECMMSTKKRYGKPGGNLAYHGYQSFAEGEVTPEECHQIGIETAKRMWGDKYEVIVTTHLNTQNHLHNHFVVNSVSFRTGEKFKNKIGDHLELRRISDEICREHEKSVLENASFFGGEKGAYWVHKDGGITNHDQVKADAERVLKLSKSRNDFLMYFRRLGYEVDETRLSVKAPDWERAVRLSSVGFTKVTFSSASRWRHPSPLCS